MKRARCPRSLAGQMALLVALALFVRAGDQFRPRSQTIAPSSVWLRSTRPSDHARSSMPLERARTSRAARARRRSRARSRPRPAANPMPAARSAPPRCRERQFAAKLSERRHHRSAMIGTAIRTDEPADGCRAAPRRTRRHGRRNAHRRRAARHRLAAEAWPGTIPTGSDLATDRPDAGALRRSCCCRCCGRRGASPRRLRTLAGAARDFTPATTTARSRKAGRTTSAR